DRIVMKENIAPRLSDSLESALRLGEGRVLIDVMGEEELLFSEHHACPICGFSIGELEPKMFSFNSPFGACPECDGLGMKLEVDPELVIPNSELTLKEHAIAPWEPTSSQYYPELLKTIAKHYKIPMDVPVGELADSDIEKLMLGSKKEKIRFRYTNEFGNTRDSDIYLEGVLRNV